MSRVERKKDQRELINADIFEMTDAEIKSLISELILARERAMNSVTPSVNLLNQQIEFAQHQLSARSSDKLAKISIFTSTIAVVLAAAGILLR